MIHSETNKSQTMRSSKKLTCSENKRQLTCKQPPLKLVINDILFAWLGVWLWWECQKSGKQALTPRILSSSPKLRLGRHKEEGNRKLADCASPTSQLGALSKWCPTSKNRWWIILLAQSGTSLAEASTASRCYHLSRLSLIQLKTGANQIKRRAWHSSICNDQAPNLGLSSSKWHPQWTHLLTPSMNLRYTHIRGRAHQLST